MFWRGKDRVIDPLDRVLLKWSRRDPFTVRNLLDGGGICEFGASGSGKTSSSGKVIARALVRMRDSCGLICNPKPEDIFMWRQIFDEAQRRDDLLEFDADGSNLRCNFLAEAARYGHTREIVRCLTTIGETLNSGQQRGNDGESAYWQSQQERMLYNGTEVLKTAKGSVSAPDLQAFITSAANSPAQLRDPSWQSGFHCRMMEAAYLAPKSAMQAHDFELAFDYWYGEVPAMADRTKSSIVTGVLGLLHVFNTSIVRELVSTSTNVSPDDMLEHRKWVIVNIPPAMGAHGSFINAGWKYLTQRRVLARNAMPGDPIHVCWCDEASQFANSFDGIYAAQSRSHLGCLVFLAQSLHSYYSVFKGESGRHQADALLSGFGHRLFHSINDVQTAEWASALTGKRLEVFIGGSMQPAQDVYDELMGHQQFSGNFSMHYEPGLQARDFMQGLRTGGKRNGFICDARLIKSGEPFSSGDNFLHVSFSQR
jgi:hypothetical protein